MSLDLAKIVRSRSRRRRTITFRPIEPATGVTADLAAILVQIAREWTIIARDRILPAYATALAQAEPMTTDRVMVRDDIRDLGGEMDVGDESVYRLILRLTPELRNWNVRAERVHRNKFVSSAKVATGVDLTTILTASGVEETLEAVYQRNLSLIRNIGEDTRGKIGDIVFRGFQNRTPRRDVAKEIANATGLARDRALRIASDQSTKLSASLDRERQEEIGITQFKWVHSGKVHFRPEHKARDGKIYSWEKNDLGGDLPGVAINCGCKAQAYLDLDE